MSKFAARLNVFQGHNKSPDEGSSESVEHQNFEREKLAFEENNRNLQQLNSILWRIPFFAMALTGGLWFGIISYRQSNLLIPVSLLLFAALANLVFRWILYRVRELISAHIDQVRDFYPAGFPTPKGGKRIWQKDRFVVRAFAAMMLVIAALNVMFAIILVLDGNPGEAERLRIGMAQAEQAVSQGIEQFLSWVK